MRLTVNLLKVNDLRKSSLRRVLKESVDNLFLFINGSDFEDIDNGFFSYLKKRRVKGIISKEFPLSVFRNLINNGIIPLKTTDLKELNDRKVVVDFDNNFIGDENGNAISFFNPLDDFVIKLFNAGGLLNYKQ